ncbi:MAG: hypothetical protein KJO07_01910 [Deltaproteobacteria bacterium]|nr:hypothetical protein [Deltaproteobacteria bacterium]
MRWAFLGVLVALAGCTSLYGDEFFRGDALSVDIEVVGALEEGRPGLVLIGTGSGIDAQASIGASWADASLEPPSVSAAEVASDGTTIVAVLDLPVLEYLALSESLELELEVRQQDDDRAVRATTTVVVSGLDELELVCAAGETCELATDDLAERYSRIDIRHQGTGPLRFLKFVGTRPAALEATESIHLDGIVLLADESSAGSCPGGEPGQAADCINGGAGGQSFAGLRAAGGGGGGFVNEGGQGVGRPDFYAQGGAKAGSRWLVPFGELRPGGGGGGGSIEVPELAGGEGGRSGGALRLAASRVEGQFIIDAAGRSGSNGQSGSGNTCDVALPLARAGGGGGGAGGAVYIEATRELNIAPLFVDETGAGLLMSAVGGSGGNSGQDSHISCPTGGRGSDGAIRIDAPELQLGFLTAPGPVRGPVFFIASPITREVQPVITVIAEPGEHQVTVNGELDLPMLSVGFGQINPRLRPGANEVCVHIEADLDRRCQTLAYLP